MLNDECFYEMCHYPSKFAQMKRRTRTAVSFQDIALPAFLPVDNLRIVNLGIGHSDTTYKRNRNLRAIWPLRIRLLHPIPNHGPVGEIFCMAVERHSIWKEEEEGVNNQGCEIATFLKSVTRSISEELKLLKGFGIIGRLA